MKTFDNLSNGERVTALIGTYDISRFTSIARNNSPEEVYALLTEICGLASRRVPEADGMII